MNRNIIKFFLSALFVWIFSAYVFSAEKIVIVTEQYDPYEFIQNGKWTGLDVETITEMAKRAKIEIVIQEYPWARCLEMMKNGSADAIISTMKSVERKAFLLYPDVNISDERNVIFAKKSFSKKITKLDDLSGETIGTVRGYEYPASFMNASNLKKEDSTDNIELLKKLNGDRFSLVITNELVCYSIISKSIPELKNNIKTVYIVGKDPMYIAFSKKSPNAVKLFALCNKTLKEMKEDGTISKIVKKYSK